MSDKRRKDGLSKADQEAWKRVSETLQPLGARKRSEAVSAKSDDAETSPPPIPRPRKQSAVHTVHPEPHRPVRGASKQLDKRTFDRFRKGKLQAERRIDLHGMTAARAQAALKSFIISSAADDCRVVLVITGKGRLSDDTTDAIPQRRGVIRRSLPYWLGSAPLNDLVLQIAPAQAKDGGGGAFYVYLKRRR